MRAEIITIGDEILIGQTIDTNSAWMAKELNLRGIDLLNIQSIQDNQQAITTSLDLAASRADVILITGGLGPTNDDITKVTLCTYFNTSLVLHQPSLDNIRERFKRRGIPLLKVNEDQALVPADCTPILNEKGTAPGMLFQRNDKIIVSMPGVPYEMKDMMLKHVLPVLENQPNGFKIFHQTVTVINIPESVLSDRLQDIERSLPDTLKLAYLPHLNLVRLRLTAKDRIQTREQLKAETSNWMNKIKLRLDGQFIEGELTLAAVVGNMLKEGNKTLACAESCTGGYISHCITAIAGSSEYFRGSMVSYANDIKSSALNVNPKHFTTVGSVSEEVAREMAKNAQALFKADYCISTTGIAGPTGATETKEVGLVYIGLALPNGSVLVKKCQFSGSRMQIIERTTYTAFEFLRQQLNDQ